MTVAQDSRVVVVGQGYVGLPLAMRAVEVGHDVVGFDVDEDRVDRLRRPSSFIDDVTDDELARRAGHRPLPPDRRRARPRRLRHRGGHACRPRCATAHPTCSFIEDAARAARAAPAPAARASCWSRRPTRARPRRCSRPILEAGSGLRAGADFHLGYSPERIDPGNPTWGLRNTPKIVSGVDDDVAGPRSRPSTTASSTGPSRRPAHARGRAGEAAGEHLPARQHRAGQRAGDLLPRARHRRLVGRSTRPRPSRSGSCSSRPGPGSAGTACRSTRRTCRGRSAGRSAGPSGSWRSPTTSTTTCPTTSSRRVVEHLNRRRRAVNGSRVLLRRPDLQAQLRRRPRSRPPQASRTGSSDLGARAACRRSLGRAARGARRASSSSSARPRSSRTADVVVVLTDHDAIDWQLLGPPRRRRPRHPQPAHGTGRRPAVTGAASRWTGSDSVATTPASPKSSP